MAPFAILATAVDAHNRAYTRSFSPLAGPSRASRQLGGLTKVYYALTNLIRNMAPLTILATAVDAHNRAYTRAFSPLAGP